MMPILIIILLIIASLVLVRRFLLIVEVRGYSMLPTLVGGDRMLVCRYWRNIESLKQKIVVFKHPIATDTETLFIKRLKALPYEHYTTYLPWTGTTVTWVIPDDRVFVESDNKSNRGDSRSWGPLPIENIVGVAILQITKVKRLAHHQFDVTPEIGFFLNSSLTQNNLENVPEQE